MKPKSPSLALTRQGRYCYIFSHRPKNDARIQAMLYKLKRDDIETSSRVDVKNPAEFGLKEEDIENFLRSHLAEFVSADRLLLLGQERPFQEEADLFALDKEGTLYLFELKRWESNPENLLQVMRYGQKFGRYAYEELEDLAKRLEEKDDSWDLAEAHKEHFDLDEQLATTKFNQDQVFVLVTNGIDGDTISAINYWRKKGIRIECSPYRVYNIDEAPYIQFDTYNPDAETLVEENAGYFIVNTNKKYDSNAWQDMLSNNKASAYGAKKGTVWQISKFSLVYLYHTDVGVIAKGKAKETYLKNNEDEEFYVPLEIDWKLEDEKEWADKAPTAREINDEMNSGHRFRPVVFSISKEMAEAIDKIAKRRGATG